MAASRLRAGTRRAVARALASVWFRSRQREGIEPSDGPALFVLNHPNGLLDPLVATALLERPPRMLAKATLWRIPILLPFLAVFDPIPVQRRQDGAVEAGATERTFAAVHEALARGEAVAIFPEGVSHGRRDLAPLKTGAARIALSSPVPARLVPAGLVYGGRETFRHSVLLRIGEPIEHGDLSGTDHTTVETLTQRIRDALYPLTVHGSDDVILQLAESLAWLLAEGPTERASLDAVRARVRALAGRLASLDEAARTDIARRVEHARALLDQHGVRPDQVAYAYSRDEIRRWLPGFAFRVLLLPFIVTIGLLFWPAYRATAAVIGRFSLDIDVVATYKFLLGLVLWPTWLLLLAAVAGWMWGPSGVAAMLLAGMAAFIALPLAERVREDMQAIRGFLRRHDPHLAVGDRERAERLAAFPELE